MARGFEATPRSTAYASFLRLSLVSAGVCMKWVAGPGRAGQAVAQPDHTPGLGQSQNPTSLQQQRCHACANNKCAFVQPFWGSTSRAEPTTRRPGRASKARTRRSPVHKSAGDGANPKGLILKMASPPVKHSQAQGLSARILRRCVQPRSPPPSRDQRGQRLGQAPGGCV